MSQPPDAYSIRQMVDLTGLSEFTLRGWENRYKAFKPRRGPTGRRTYRHSDVQKALLLRELLVRGHRIGAVAELSNGDLQLLLGKDAAAVGQPPGKFKTEIEGILQVLSLQDWAEVEARLRRAIRSAKPKAVLTDLIVPLVRELGQMVALDVISISQEHIFSAILKERLYVLRDAAPKSTRKSRFVVASPEGDFHELGILIAHTMLAHAGFPSLYLGPNTPKRDLCETALRFGATHLLVGSTVSRKEGAREDLYSFLHFLDQHLAKDIEIWLGGRNASMPPEQVKRRMLGFSSLLEFESALAKREADKKGKDE